MINVLDVQTSLAKHWRSYSLSTNYHVMNKGSCNAYACGKAWRRNPSHTGVISMESTPGARTLNFHTIQSTALVEIPLGSPEYSRYHPTLSSLWLLQPFRYNKSEWRKGKGTPTHGNVLVLRKCLRISERTFILTNCKLIRIRLQLIRSVINDYGVGCIKRSCQLRPWLAYS